MVMIIYEEMDDFTVFKTFNLRAMDNHAMHLFYIPKDDSQQHHGS